MLHALLVDDDVNFALGLAEVVGREGFATKTANTLKDAKAEITKSIPDVLLVDLHLPDGSGLDLFKELEGSPGAEIILITGQATVDTAVEAMRRGASDYLIKPVDFSRVKQVLTNVARTRELKEQIGNLRGELRKLGRFGPLIGASPPMQRVYDLIAKVAQTDATVMLTGETGTGKELVAETVHSLSRRHKEPFLPINCGAVSPNLIESELFGHERGSFTGADRLHRGYYERAHRGTLFLDEITEMPAELQVKLLRVLESGKVTRIGGNESLTSDVRVIAATNRKPEDAVAKGKLREDLLYRLNVFPIPLPPLRDRREDVDLLAEHFLALLNKEHDTSKEFTRPALNRLRSHSWPGNVRELKNLVHRAFILAEDHIGLDCLPLGVQESAGSSLNLKVGTSLGEAERRLILATLEEAEGDKKKAAEVLGISLKTLYNRLNEYKSA
ncbi:MAG: sigma-54-dependent Fis family transcriptional regulator [Acidobacteria bacterium]|nr:MAG: sigma-54-dependent Fis family transcriptional regulator [Acidobacteriota bacterium]